jgi:hypothetical protein
MKPLARSAIAALGSLFVSLGTCFGAGQVGFIDFEDQPVGFIVGGTLTVNAAGIPVTFSGLGLNIREFGPPFPPTKVLSTAVDSQSIIVTFGASAQLNYAEIENLINGRFTDEVDIIKGTAFNLANLPIDTETSAATILRLDGPGIVRVQYDDSESTGYVIDNFRFEVVPEPTTLLLVMCGFLLSLVTRQKKT